ncbi:MAG TPA: ribosomal-protein-alanine N-acetyltransferase [Haliea salexigens]|uniref:[Ribosomal protein bS18]-alanine N-acetyltransferase n=1 Tax=Haliea salexigens TaxID=287487 RepID=A0A3C1KRI8_9GAMM|nr:ribosomal-protein-alanine N-acetyltransferase [Haliea sp.]HAN29319.1 ribosomal-protein-alanine N-acetyltransferase [Haliea salexigens]HAN69966.1 ribosomal-protein-alanine N-acetyltransferase [Halieaceae bacterium]
MSPVIRPALPEDIPSMASLDAQASAWPWRESQYVRCCAVAEDASERALLLEVNGALQGFVVYAREFDDGSIYNIVVASSARRQGFGESLLQSAVDAMLATGARRCVLEVRKSNLPARRLYEQMGFHVDGLRRNYYPLPPGREDAVLMSLDL